MRNNVVPPDMPHVLRQFAESYLQRPLQHEEISVLQEFLADLSEVRQEASFSNRNVEQLFQKRNEVFAKARQHLLDTVQAATSLNGLRPATLPATPYTGDQLVIAQIAERLANLVQTEVSKCFEKNFGPLRQQLETTLFSLNPDGLSTPDSRHPDQEEKNTTHEI
jgi:hypothetical protein